MQLHPDEKTGLKILGALLALIFGSTVLFTVIAPRNLNLENCAREYPRGYSC